MEDYKYIQGGEIIAIPLFLTKDKKLKIKKREL